MLCPHNCTPPLGTQGEPLRTSVQVDLWYPCWAWKGILLSGLEVPGALLPCADAVLVSPEEEHGPGRAAMILFIRVSPA